MTSVDSCYPSPGQLPRQRRPPGLPFCDHRNRTTAAVSFAAVRQTLKAFLKDESGAVAIEYGLIAAGISVTIIAVVMVSAPNSNRRSRRSQPN